MTKWEYRVVSLASFDPPGAELSGNATAVARLNTEGLQGWEAVGVSARENGDSAVLMKRPLAEGRASGGRV